MREAIEHAHDGDTITFNSAVFNGEPADKILLDPKLGSLFIAKNLTIDGDLNNDGLPDVTIDANNATRLLFVSSGTVTLEGLTLQNGMT